MDKQNTDIQISTTPLNPQVCIDFVACDEVGATDVFVGTVRNVTKNKSVLHLEFEGYVPMAISELQKIVEQTFQRWPVQKIAVHHRLGHIKVGGIAVIIAVSTPHRKAAFEACQFIIDSLKKTVPIWKKEFFEDGAVWVAANP